jgi:exopolysaccharide biosynthesis polyprenyl glycosylphosphotransferase
MTEAHIYRQKLALLTTDVLAFLIAFTVGMQLRFGAHQLSTFEFGEPPWEEMLIALPVMMAVHLLSLAMAGGYQIGPGIFRELARIVQGMFVFIGAMLSVTFFYRGFEYSRGFAVLFLVSCLGLTFLGRIVVRALRARIATIDRESRILLVGDSGLARHIADSMHGERRATVVGVLDDEAELGADIAGAKVIGRIRDLADVAREHSVNRVLVTNPKMDDQTHVEILDTCLGANLLWQVVPSAYELMLDRAEFDVLAGVPVIGLRRSNIRGVNRLFKRAFDIVVATIALIVVSPLMLLVASLIKLTSKGPVLFSQVRIGEHGQPFRFFKFRSMRVDSDDTIHRAYTQKLITEGAPAHADQAGAVYKIKDDPRLIPIGAFIRKYSIDELPQLLNVLLGEMSLIGPRPPIPYEVEVYRRWHMRRFEGPPGITGLWQVSGRNRLSFEEMVKLDIEYLENWSLMRDLKILWRTMGVVLFDRAY